MDENCVRCGSPAIVFSIEPDNGEEVLACYQHLAEVITSLFDRRLASGELKVYDVRGA